MQIGERALSVGNSSDANPVHFLRPTCGGGVRINPNGEFMKLDVYLNYAGNCEQAFRFYEEHLGAKVIMITPHGENAKQANFPPNWKDKVLHAQIEIGGAVVMGADIPQAEPMRSAYLSLTTETAAEAERIYAILSDGGQVFMKMEETFYAKRFAMLRDRFGTAWMLLGEQKAQ